MARVYTRAGKALSHAASASCAPGTTALSKINSLCEVSGPWHNYAERYILHLTPPVIGTQASRCIP